MKKLSLLVALILCVTIGGVYATWTYAGNEIKEQNATLTNKMGEVVLSGAAGAYHFSDNTLRFTVEPEDGTYTPTLVASGSATLKFSAEPTISPDALAKALAATITVEATDLTNAVYNGKQIYTLTDNFKITLNENSWTKSDNNYTYTINATDLLNAVSIEDFELNNVAQYDTFTAEQRKAVFRVYVNPAQ